MAFTDAAAVRVCMCMYVFAPQDMQRMITSLNLVIILNTEWRLVVKLQGLAFLDWLFF